MPVLVHAEVRHIAQEEFGRTAYRVMDQIFAVHNELGRFFDEDVYRDAVARRVPNSQVEVLIEVRFEDFMKPYYIDLLVDGGAPFELKTVRTLTDAHWSQLLNYLLLTELSHGKLVNCRPELVDHEFVNSHLTRTDRTAFRIDDRNWQDMEAPERSLRTWLESFLRDVGTGLDVNLYTAAAAHYWGGEDVVLAEVDIIVQGERLGTQKIRQSAPGWAFKVTTIDQTGQDRFEEHTRRFLHHTTLRGIHWINVTRDVVSFRTIEKEVGQKN